MLRWRRKWQALDYNNSHLQVGSLLRLRVYISQIRFHSNSHHITSPWASFVWSWYYNTLWKPMINHPVPDEVVSNSIYWFTIEFKVFIIVITCGGTFYGNSWCYYYMAWRVISPLFRSNIELQWASVWHNSCFSWIHFTSVIFRVSFFIDKLHIAEIKIKSSWRNTISFQTLSYSIIFWSICKSRADGSVALIAE
jgi:hypothetical protein